MKSVGVLRFLGTNCDRDVHAAAVDLGLNPQWVWYADHADLSRYEALFVPGGFSHGDYLRCGALAAKAPVMTDLRAAAKRGTPVLGICNGFQILCEAGLLPGALVRNEHRKFVDLWVDLRIEAETAFTPAASRGRTVRLPIAHGEGRYHVEADELARLRDRDQVWCTYQGYNPNGSVGDVAGVTNVEKNVCALMPHPERALHSWMGGTDGREILGGA